MFGRLLMASVAVVGLARIASADVIRLTFTGYITEADPGFGTPAVNAGDPFAVSMDFDPSLPADNEAVGVNLLINGLAYAPDPFYANSQAYTNSVLSLDGDVLHAAAWDEGYGPTVTATVASPFPFSWIQNQQDSLPAETSFSASGLLDYDYQLHAYGNITGGSIGPISSGMSPMLAGPLPVPEPSWLGVALAAGMGLSLLRRRPRRA